MRLAVMFLALVLVACAKPVTKEEVAGLDYGPKPTRWQEEVKSYLAVRLTDPKNAIIEFRTEPAQMYQRKVAFRDMHYGWAVCVWVNDKNSSGAFSGFYPMTFFFRDEKIVAVNGGPDEGGLVASRYAREQCAQLGG